MATGIGLQLGGTLVSPPFGKFKPYEGIYDGTLAYWDAGLSGAAGTAVPANGATITNLVRDQAAAITGLTAADCDFSVTATGAAGTIAKERTPKGAVHVALTRSGQTAAASWTMTRQANMLSWLYNNTDAGADYCYLSLLWVKMTREQLTSTVPPSVMFMTGSSNANYHRYAGASGGRPTTYPVSDLVTTNAANVGVPKLIAVASKGWTGTKPTTVAGMRHADFCAGGAGPWTSSTGYNTYPSLAIYNVQDIAVELADVAGADLSAKITNIIAEQQALMTAAFAAGGRFYADTLTADDTLLAA